MSAAKPGKSWTLHNIGRLIKFGSKYMESGFLDLLNTAIGNADTYKPAIIRFNPFVTTKSTVLPNASSQRVVTDGDESLAVGCKTKLGSIDVYSESTSYHYDSTPATFCEPEKIRAKKQCQLRVPPSVYTGKLRLMVQAIYGSTRDDYSYTTESNGMDNLKIGATSLGIALPTAGLYTAPDGSYWLIKIGNSVTYQMLVAQGSFETAGIDPLSEAYQLSRLVPSGSVVTMPGSDLTTALSGYSGPLAYGWKFNSSGDHASIVIVGDEPAMAGKTFPSGSAASASGIKTALLTVQIGWGSATLTPEFISASVTETGLHMPYAQVKTFYPVVIDGVQQMQVLVADPGNTGVVNDWIAPIYCYYDSSDALKVVRVRNGAFESVPVDDGRPPEVVPGATRLSTMARRGGTYYPARKACKPAGIAIDSDVYEQRRSQQTGSTIYREIEYYESPYRKENSIAIMPAAAGNYVRYYWVYLNSGDPGIEPDGSVSVSVPGVSKSPNPILIIPFDDAESVIVADGMTTNATGNPTGINYVLAGNTLTYKREVWYKKYGNSNNTYWLYKVRDEYPVWPESPTSVAWGGETSTVDSDALSRHPDKRKKRQFAKLYSSRLEFPIAIYDNDSNYVQYGTPFPTMSLDGLIAVTAVSPFFPNPIFIRSSYSGSIRWSVAGDIAGRDGWPDYQYLSPVGWA